MKYLSTILLTVLAMSVGLCSCTKKQAPISEGELKAVRSGALPERPDDPVWDTTPVHPAKLLLQDIVEPRLMKASTALVNVAAITNGEKIAFRLSWDDASQDDRPGPGRFADACAVQLPISTGPDVPAPQMGEEGRPVEITYWSSYYQAIVEGRASKIEDIYPRAKVDHYPFEAAPLATETVKQKEFATRYAPAIAAGNPVSGPRRYPTEDLIAEGPGSLRPAATQSSSGSGHRTRNKWQVLLIRPLPKGLQIGGRTQTAFAVWQGSEREVGARKMRTAWIPLSIGAKP
jgi:hypothetical protein